MDEEEKNGGADDPHCGDGSHGQQQTDRSGEMADHHDTSVSAVSPSDIKTSENIVVRSFSSPLPDPKAAKAAIEERKKKQLSELIGVGVIVFLLLICFLLIVISPTPLLKMQIFKRAQKEAPEKKKDPAAEFLEEMKTQAKALQEENKNIVFQMKQNNACTRQQQNCVRRCSGGGGSDGSQASCMSDCYSGAGC